MTATTETASEVLWFDDLIDRETRADIEKQVVETADKDRRLRDLILTTPILRSAILRAVTAALHFDPLVLLADGWCTARDIRAACREAGKSEALVVLRLSSHRIERDIRPAIKVSTGAEKSFELDVGLGLAGTFDGIALTVRDNRLESVGEGTCDLALLIRVGGRTVISKDIRTIDLPAEYRFAQPLALR
ncbi:MAG: hypothetical protein QM647_14285 [Asticcacaulis sp.]|uniref:hypothetical protein n=1 Tax=Asticcacaulis sp. TaxID=1872648 RepID=UPI0039E6BC02